MKKRLIVFGFVFGVLFSSIISAATLPVVLYTDILSGPNTGGENNNGVYLSIFGTGFGLSQGTSKVYINDIEVADYKYWGVSQHGRSDIQQISVQLGSGITGTNLPIKVVVDGVESNTDHTFTVRSGDIYFLDNVNGNQATGVIGDITKPFRYVQETFNRADFGAGDVIVMRDEGNVWNDKCCTSYDDFLWIRDKEGTSIDNMMIMGYPGEKVNIVYDGRIVLFYNSDGYTTISNLVMDGAGTGGQVFGFRGASYNRLVNVELTGMDGRNSGAGTAGGSKWNNKVLGCYIHDTGSTDPDIAKLFHGLYFDSDAHDIEIGWNHISNINGGRGIQIFGGNPHQNVIVHDNLIHDTDLDPILYSTKSDKGCEVYNNVLYNFGGSGIRLYSYDLECEVYHNTIFANNGRGILLQRYTSAEIKNNLIYVSGSGIYYDQDEAPNPIASNNLWYGAGLPPSWDSSAINQDPLFVNPSGFDFHLQSSSPAVDTGVDVGMTYDHDGNLRPMDGDSDGLAGYDVGAYEYTGEYIPPTPDTTPPSIPQNILVVNVSENQINLSWDVSTDSESGILRYNVYRNGVLVGSSSTNFFSDSGLGGGLDYLYKISAVNNVGLISENSSEISQTTLSDDVLPITLASPVGGTFSSPQSVTLSVDETATTYYTLDDSLPTIDSLIYSSPLTISSNTTLNFFSVDASGNVESVKSETYTINALNSNECEDILLLYHLDNNSIYGESDTLVYDFAEKGNDGVPVGALPIIEGKYDGAYNFDGIDDYLTINPISVGVDSSISIWVNFNSLVGSDYGMQTIIAKDIGGCDCNDLSVVWDATSSLIRARYQSSSGSAWLEQDPLKLSISPFEWHQISIILNSSEGLSLYIDGILHDNNKNLNGGVVLDSFLMIGQGYGGSDDAPHSFFNGKMDEVVIWNKSLSSQEVQNVYVSDVAQSCSQQEFHKADTTQDGCVDLTEADTFVARWKNEDADVTISDIISMLAEYKKGCS